MESEELHPHINRGRIWPEIPKHLGRQIVSSNVLRLGTLEDIIGFEEAEAFFNQPDPFEDARKSAAEKLGLWFL